MGEVDEGVEGAVGDWARPDAEGVARGGLGVESEGDAVDGVVERGGVAAGEGLLVAL